MTSLVLSFVAFFLFCCAPAYATTGIQSIGALWTIFFIIGGVMMVIGFGIAVLVYRKNKKKWVFWLTPIFGYAALQVIGLILLAVKFLVPGFKLGPQ